MGSFVLFFPFISSCSLFKSSPPKIDYDGSKGSMVLRTAMSQYGSKYSYGKADPSKGFDCSGLIWWAYGQHGIKLPRSTNDQAKFGKSVPKNSLRQGDIIVFRVGKRLHNGLVADRGRFVHAPSSGGSIRVEEINSDYWKNRFVSARRVIL